MTVYSISCPPLFFRSIVFCKTKRSKSFRLGALALSPAAARGTFPGFVYQLGNFLASANATIQAVIAVNYGQGYGVALASVAVLAALLIALLSAIGSEAREADLTLAADPTPL